MASFMLPTSLRTSIIDHAIDALPNEAVGLVAGRTDFTAQAVERLVNIGAMLEYFADPHSQFLAEQRLEAAGLRPIAIYHSHPYGASVLSKRDVAFARQRQLVQIVVAFREGKSDAHVRAFMLRGAVPQEIPIVLDW